MQNNLIQSALKLSFTCICLAIFFSCNTHAEIESRIDTLEKVVSVSLSKQMDDMQKSITRLESANSHLEQLVSEIGDDVSSLKSQKAVFEKDIADLRLLIESQSSNLQSWAEGLFSTLSQYQKITEDIAVIKKSLSEYEGEINKLPLLQKELENCEIDITLIKDELLQIIDNIDSIKKQIAQIIESIQSVVVIPDYSDGSILMTGSNANEIKFEVYPLSAAENISKIGVSALSLDYVTTETKSSDVMANIPILKTSFNGRSLSVIADGTDLPQNVLSGEQPINARLRVSDGTVTRSSDYFPIHFKKDICLTLAADLIAPTTVRLSGYAEGLTEHPDDISVGFEYSTAADMSDAHKINALLNENEKTFSIICSGLAPESVYFYRAYFLMQEDAHWGEIKSFETTNYEMVDMGLSVKWATSNVGAETITDIGECFAWGEIAEKEEYGAENYSNSSIWIIPEQNDVASQRMGGMWRMPTRTEFQELVENCDTYWIKDYDGTGISGMLVCTRVEEGKSQKLFFPSTGSPKGYLELEGVVDSEVCRYWGASGIPQIGIAWGTVMLGRESWTQKIKPSVSFFEACYGIPIRPVWGERKPEVQSATLNDITFVEGSEKQVVCDVLPLNVHSKYVEWTIDDPTIAYISERYENSCVVYGIQPGTTVLRATCSSGITKESQITIEQRTYSEPNLVDMGLSVKWASYNVGATSPEETGTLYLWGDCDAGDYEGKDYKWWMPGNERNAFGYIPESSTRLSGYNPVELYGTVDNKGVLDSKDDVASQLWGSDWRIPTEKEWQELIDNSDIAWVEDYLGTGVSGTLFRSKKPGYTASQLFFPTHSQNQGVYSGGYWSSTVAAPSIFCSYAYLSRTDVYSGFPEGYVQFSNSLIECPRGSLFAIRPVFGQRLEQASGIELSHKDLSVREWSEIPISAIFTPENPRSEEIIWSFGDDNVAYLDGYSSDMENRNRLHSAAKGNTTITATSVDGGHKAVCNIEVLPAQFNTEYVDLGLGVKWAACNLGAITPQEPGMFYRWGETTPIKLTMNNFETYPWANMDTSPVSAVKYTKDGDILDPDDDVAHVCLGGNWRMPTYKEMSELVTQCTWTLVENYEGTGVRGYKVTGRNGNSIFFPFVGYYDGKFLYNHVATAIWTSTSYDGMYARAMRCSTTQSKPQSGRLFKLSCFTIRPVYTE